MYLRFRSASVAGNALFHLEWCVFHDGDALFGYRVDDDATALCDVDDGGLVRMEKEFFDPAKIRLERIYKLGDVGFYVDKLERDIEPGSGVNDSIIDNFALTAVGFYDSEAHRGRPWIYAQNY